MDGFDLFNPAFDQFVSEKKGKKNLKETPYKKKMVDKAIGIIKSSNKPVKGVVLARKLGIEFGYFRRDYAPLILNRPGILNGNKDGNCVSPVLVDTSGIYNPFRRKPCQPVESANGAHSVKSSNEKP